MSPFSKWVWTHCYISVSSYIFGGSRIGFGKYLGIISPPPVIFYKTKRLTDSFFIHGDPAQLLWNPVLGVWTTNFSWEGNILRLLKKGLRCGGRTLDCWRWFPLIIYDLHTLRVRLIFSVAHYLGSWLLNVLYLAGTPIGF